MRLPFHPKPGTILICDDGAGFIAPEMVKRRLVVSISPKLKRRDDLISVIPLSSTKPTSLESWHRRVDVDAGPHWGAVPRWAKCDMVATVSFGRLTLPFSKNPQTGRRKYMQIELGDEIVADLRQAVAAALGIVIER